MDDMDDNEYDDELVDVYECIFLTTAQKLPYKNRDIDMYLFGDTIKLSGKFTSKQYYDISILGINDSDSLYIPLCNN